MPTLGPNTFCIVTGASRGLGREISIQFSRNTGRDSLFLLLARDIDGLNETKALMIAGTENVRVKTKQIDLENSEPESFIEVIAECLAENESKINQFQHSVLVHNAGSLGDISKFVSQIEDIKELEKYYKLNVFSFVALNSKFLKCFKENESCKRTIVNISSLAAISPINGFGFYCSGKAARESFMKVLAAEEPSIRVISYAPGPLKTEMTDAIIKSAVPETKEIFKGVDFLTCEESVKKLVKLLEEDKFESGQRYDFYDL